MSSNIRLLKCSVSCAVTLIEMVSSSHPAGTANNSKRKWERRLGDTHVHEKNAIILTSIRHVDGK